MPNWKLLQTKVMMSLISDTMVQILMTVMKKNKMVIVQACQKSYVSPTLDLEVLIYSTWKKLLNYQKIKKRLTMKKTKKENSSWQNIKMNLKKKWIKIEDIGVHSIRKGGAIFSSSGSCSTTGCNRYTWWMDYGSHPEYVFTIWSCWWPVRWKCCIWSINSFCKVWSSSTINRIWLSFRWGFRKKSFIVSQVYSHLPTVLFWTGWYMVSSIFSIRFFVQKSERRSSIFSLYVFFKGQSSTSI